MKRQRTGAFLALAVSLLAGCTYSVERTGDDGFLREEIEWNPGQTTAADVARSLGPPDDMRVWNDRLWFVYAFEHLSRSGLELAWNSLAFFQHNGRVQFKRTLVVCFDADDRLLYHALSKGPVDRALLGFDY